MNSFSKSKPYIIAEIASAHEGQKDKAIELFKEANKTDVNAIKFQIFKADKLLSNRNDLFNDFKNIEIKFEDWEEILFSQKNNNKELIAETYDIESLEFAESLKIFKSYKISPSCLFDNQMINFYKKIQKPIILGVGGLEFDKIKKIYEEFKSKVFKLVIMLGIQSFPTKIQDINLNQIKFVKKNLDCIIGYADHTDADEKINAFSLPLLAIGLGAEVIEKHITIDREKKGNDYFSALNPQEFSEFVSTLRNLSNVLGSSSEWSINKADKNYEKFVMKYAVAKNKIFKGDKISYDNIVFKRTNIIGISGYDFNKYIGKTLKKDLEPDEIIEILHLDI